MMGPVLLLTVGGSPDPLLTAVRELGPDRVVFFCSELTKKCVDGVGKPNERRLKDDVEKLDNLVTLMGLGSAYEVERDLVVFVDEDEVQGCYRQILDKVVELRGQGCKQILIDYTGGTKSMAAALLLVAVDEGLDIHVTTGIRDNTRTVQRGQATREVGVTDLRTTRTLNREVERSLRVFDYVGAEEQLLAMVRPRDLSKELRHRVQYLRSVCQALAAWDVFDHSHALDCIDGASFGRSSKLRERLLQPLKRLFNVRKWLAEGGGLPAHTCGYELVEDLILNARRRAHLGRYDDAVGRFYRALEMLAQVRLKLQFGIDTSRVMADQIPEAFHTKYLDAGSRDCQLGLRRAYELLQDRDDPVVGPVYAERSKVLLNALLTRNASLFAHGYQPITKKEYELFLGFVGNFLEQLLSRLFGKTSRIAQLPTASEEILD